MEITEELYHLWADQLHREYEDICFQHSVSLQPPVIAISDAEMTCGSWETDIRRISISSSLIQNYDWNLVIDILKHEMAHQICAEIFMQPRAHHSEVFSKACGMLGLSEQFHRSGLDMAALQQPGQQHNNGGRPVIRKIRKLLALTSSDNRYEAELAMSKAKMLIEQHNISEYEARLEEGMEYRIIKLNKKRVAGYQTRIAALLSKYFYVRLIQAYCYDPFQDARFKTFEVFGKRSNVEVAVHCFTFLERCLHNLWEESRRSLPGKGIRVRNSYMYGVIRGVSEVLAEKEKGRYDDGLVGKGLLMHAGDRVSVKVISDREIDLLIMSRYPKLRKKKGGTAVIHRDVFQQGIQAGKRIKMHDVVTASNIERKVLLTH